MNKQQFTKFLSSLISKKGISSKSLDAFKSVLNGHTDQDAFYTKVKDPEKLKYYVNLIDNDRIHIRDDQDYAPLNSSDYWDRDTSSFVYTAKILPEVRDRFSDTYSKIYNGDNILPAGLDEKSRKEKDLKTIWNEVEKADPSKKYKKKEDKTSSTKQEKIQDFFEDPTNRDQIKKALQKSGFDNPQDSQVKAISKFVTGVLNQL